MSAFQTLTVTIVRNVRTLTASRGEALEETPVAGSPFTGCRFYQRRKGDFNGREQTPVGLATIQTPVLSIPVVDLDLKPNDIAILPNGKRLRIDRVRPYSSGVQCDVEEGTT